MSGNRGRALWWLVWVVLGSAIWIVLASVVMIHVAARYGK